MLKVRKWKNKSRFAVGLYTFEIILMKLVITLYVLGIVLKYFYKLTGIIMYAYGSYI